MVLIPSTHNAFDQLYWFTFSRDQVLILVLCIVGKIRCFSLCYILCSLLWMTAFINCKM